MTEPPTRLGCLVLWAQLGGTADGFEEWMTEPRRTLADAKAQLLAAHRGNLAGLIQDTNPPAGALADLAVGEETP